MRGGGREEEGRGGEERAEGDGGERRGEEEREGGERRGGRGRGEGGGRERGFRSDLIPQICRGGQNGIGILLTERTVASNLQRRSASRTREAAFWEVGGLLTRRS